MSLQSNSVVLLQIQPISHQDRKKFDMFFLEIQYFSNPNPK
ncbi:22230_t:CDS:2 [Gigaspora margarita]|uniref:22230_t:CDS:1 n=1 Tax=Gigaspora margarita TaxID=4874 RepID=A0ABN7UMC6_GIGMA|nr:22230_t:CDS:2 [Gigaspora margarita]